MAAQHTPARGSARSRRAVAAVAVFATAAALAVAPQAQAAAEGSGPQRSAAGPAIFVSNGGSDSITEYALDASGDAAPLVTIAGSNTELDSPSDLVVGADGTIYVTNLLNDSVTVYAPGASGNVAPIATIKGQHTGLKTPQGINLDADGNLWVNNDGAVTVYAPGARGDATPLRKITGPRLNRDAGGVIVDATGSVYAVGAGNDSVLRYGPSASGDVAPAGILAGPNTGLREPTGIWLDAQSQIYVANQLTDSVTTYAPGATGNAAPLRTLAGSATGLDQPSELFVEPTGRLYIPNYEANTLTEYAPGASGNAAPVTTIGGPSTGLSHPTGVIVLPPAPQAPTIGTAAAGDTQATVTFSAPADGVPPTSYTVSAIDHTESARGGQTATGTAGPITVTGLTNGDSYTFTVTAYDRFTAGPASAESNAVVPKAAQAITFTTTPPSPAEVGAGYTVRATGGGSGQPVVFSTDSAACTVTAGGTVRFVAAGVCEIGADQAGGAAYLPAPTVTQRITVARPTVLVAATAYAFGSGLPVLQATLTTGSGNPVAGQTITFTVNTSPGALISGGQCTARTDSRGRATCMTGASFGLGLSATYTARFAGTDAYAPATATARIL